MRVVFNRTCEQIMMTPGFLMMRLLALSAAPAIARETSLDVSACIARKASHIALLRAGLSAKFQVGE